MHDEQGNFQKWGVTQEAGDPARRYGSDLPEGWTVTEHARGPRSAMLDLERELVEKRPGPLNNEPWAGKRQAKTCRHEPARSANENLFYKADRRP